MSYSSFTGNSATYHCRNYYYSKAANALDDDESIKYCFPMQSIKNIGGLFGECVVAGGSSALVIDNISAFLENQNAKVIKAGNGREGIPEDYYLFDKFATLTPIIEYDNANISDIYDEFKDLNNKANRTICSYLCQLFIHHSSVCREGNFIYLLLSQRAETTFLQQPSNLVESELMLKVIRINHAAKLRISRQKTKLIIKSWHKIW